MKWDETELGTVAKYGKDKIDAVYLNSENYISTDNMLQDKQGITTSEYVPLEGRTSKFNKGDILVSNIRPYFKKIWFAMNDGGCSNDVIVFKSEKNKVEPKFLYYQLSKDEFFDFMMAGANGTKMPRGNKDSIPTYKLLLPPLPTQHKIASILSAYDDLIENNLKRIKLLEEIAQRTYEEWFVKFRINGKQLKLNKETGLPEGWEEISLGMFVNFHKGKKANSIVPEFQEGFERLLLLDGIESGKYPYADPKGQVIAERGNIVMLMDGARSSKVFFADKGIVGSTLSKIEITNKSISSSLLKLFFDSNFETMKTNNTGAAIPHANKNFINTMPFKKPTKDILKKWEESLDPLYKQIQNLKDQNLLLKESRDILLPRLMSGVIEFTN